MKSHNLSIPALGAVLALAAHAALAGDIAAQVPRTAAAQAAADLISRAEHAITDYVAACVSRDVQRLNGVTTGDVRIEYALDDPGTYLSMDAGSMIAGCAANTPADNSGSHVSNLWIFPTRDANAVFVQYDAPAGSAETISHRQLALVEMRGDRIFRMLNFAAVPPFSVVSTVREASAVTARALHVAARSVPNIESIPMIGRMTVTATRLSTWAERSKQPASAGEPAVRTRSPRAVLVR